MGEGRFTQQDYITFYDIPFGGRTGLMQFLGRLQMRLVVKTGLGNIGARSTGYRFWFGFNCPEFQRHGKTDAIMQYQ